ncbi:MAG: ATP-grasp domain-containing protein [Promethearchaeota archaeon]
MSISRIFNIEGKGDVYRLFKHLVCLDTSRLKIENFHEMVGYYGLEAKSLDLKRLLSSMGIVRSGDYLNLADVQREKADFLKSLDVSYALVNGREDEGHSLRRFKEELEKAGVHYDEFSLQELSFYNGELVGFPLENGYKAILLVNPEPLESDSAAVFLLKSAILKELEGRYLLIPGVEQDFIARSKLETSRLLARAHLPSPRTLVTGSVAEAVAFWRTCRSSGKSVVIKPLAKGGGWAVSKLEPTMPERKALDIIGKYKWWYGDGVLLLQEFMENQGYDKRILVLDDLIIGVEDRRPAIGKKSWIYNISKGARGEAGTLSAVQRDLVLDAARATNQFFSGIDLLVDKHNNSHVLEVNSCPGFTGFEEYVNINVASFFISYVSFFV